MSALILPIQRLFGWKIRGVRWIEIIGVVFVAAMVLSVYVAKAGAAREGARIAELERDIRENRQRVRLLRAEVSRLEQPARLEALSRQIGLEPVAVQRQATETQLPELAPPPATTAASSPAASPDPASPDLAAPVQGEAR